MSIPPHASLPPADLSSLPVFGVLPFPTALPVYSHMTTTANGRVLERLLEPQARRGTRGGAKLIGLKADRKAQARVAELARKCNERELTPEERQEYEFYVMAGEFIAILQAQVRLLLARRQGD